MGVGSVTVCLYTLGPRREIRFHTPPPAAELDARPRDGTCRAQDGGDAVVSKERQLTVKKMSTTVQRTPTQVTTMYPVRSFEDKQSVRIRWTPGERFDSILDRLRQSSTSALGMGRAVHKMVAMRWCPGSAS